MTLTELNAGLENILNNIGFGLLLTRLVTPEAWTSVNPQIATFQGSRGDLLRLDVGPMCSRMANPEYKRAVTEEYENGLKRATVREGHEFLLLYCEETHSCFLRIRSNLLEQSSPNRGVRMLRCRVDGGEGDSEATKGSARVAQTVEFVWLQHGAT